MIRRVVIAAALCVVPANPQAASATAEATRRPFALTIHTNNQERFKVEDEIRIHVSWKNTSEKPVLTAPVIPTAETRYMAFVEDENGRMAKETPFGRILRTGKGEQGQETVTVFKTAPLRYLQPGETMNQEIVLNKL